MKLIGEIAHLAGVSVPMLRRYDRVGLLKPQARSYAGYRLYGSEDLLRLREILIWRRLGFPLADIAKLLDDPAHDRGEALRHQLDIARSQLGRFCSITSGLELALAAFHAGHPLAEEEIFAGFTLGLHDDDDDYDIPESGVQQAADSPVLNDPLAGGNPGGKREPIGGGRSSRDAEGPEPLRIVATDPIRLAESLLALGVLPVGAGTYEGRFTEEPGEWPWPPLVEPIVRRRISDVGYYGSDWARVGALAPETIIDLTSRKNPNISMAEWTTEGRYTYQDFCGIAPTRLVPYSSPLHDRDPEFRHFLVEVAAATGRSDLAAQLLAIWRARLRALGAHLGGKDVGVVGTWGPGHWLDYFYSPTERHRCQVFSALGINVVVPDDLEDSRPNAVMFDEAKIAGLDVDTLFFHTRHLRREQVDALLHGKNIACLPAARNNRVFELGWEFVNSGWFSAHWQLRLVAHAFGLTQLKAGEGADLVLAAADPVAGVIELTSAFRDMDVSLCGPGLRATSASLVTSSATPVKVPPEVARDLCELPEAYCVSISDGLRSVPIDHDRESALTRLASGQASLGA